MHHLGWILLLLAVVLPGSARAEDAAKYHVYVGTYTDGGKSKGIYRCELDLKTGKLGEAVAVGETKNPTFLALHPTGKYLYAVGEISNFGGKKAGGVVAFAIDPKTGDLKKLNEQSSGGAGPCYIVVDKAGKNALVANYGGGSVACLPIGPDGKLAPASTFIQHRGKSTDAGRQEGPHAHSINLDAANHYAFAADLGTDKIYTYLFDADKGTLTPAETPSTDIAPGSGPRHFTFSPSGKFAYLINELGQTVTAFAYDAEKGTLKTIQTVKTLTKPVKGNSTAEVLVHPSGKFLYGSNRGHNSIAIFKIDQKTGKLTPAGHQGTDIKTPRNFAIAPGGKFMLVASQDGAKVSVFKIDQETGALTPTESSVAIPNPVCVRFLAVK
jgi:6-phosphogluconolactonase